MSKRVFDVAQFLVKRCFAAVLGFSASGARAAGAVRRRLQASSADAGMSTAEYAVGTIAACAFAAVLYQVVTGDSIVSALTDLITSALSSLS